LYLNRLRTEPSQSATTTNRTAAALPEEGAAAAVFGANAMLAGESS
jgi:hypothetical protein